MPAIKRKPMVDNVENDVVNDVVFEDEELEEGPTEVERRPLVRQILREAAVRDLHLVAVTGACPHRAWWFSN
jgi:hypothetical protein